MTTSDDLDLKDRQNYYWFQGITTRWMDNDVYGHVNNVNYYSYFDSIANSFLIKECGLDIQHSPQIGYIVHSECFYNKSLAFPDQLEGGLRVNRLGNSSVQYGLAIFQKGESEACAHGNFTHVFVDRNTERPQAIAEPMRGKLAALMDSGTPQEFGL